jgi:hypothetical protein
MSRHGRHGRRQHSGAAPRPRPAAQAPDRPTAPVEARTAALPEAPIEMRTSAPSEAPAPRPAPAPVDPVVGVPDADVVMKSVAPVADVPPTPSPRPTQSPMPSQAGVPSQPVVPVAAPVPVAALAPAPTPAQAVHASPSWPDADPTRPTCTVAQLRRFIKSRPWIPMHELRRRFGIDGNDDDVAPMQVGRQTLFIGLPPAEGRLMAELFGAGDVGYELSLDPVTPIVVGVYPMRPVPRG